MNQLPLNHKALFKRFICIFLPIICIVIFLSWAIYYFQYIKTQKEILLAQESNLLVMQKEFIQQTVQSMISDIKIIAADQHLNDLLNKRKEGIPSRMSAEFLSFSKYKGIYDQVRVLDINGMELIRVDLRGNRPVLVAENKLQFKGKRYYFRDTLKLNKGEIFFSPLDLNIENGKIEHPLKPMIRLGTPIFNREGEKQGVLILNYLGKKLFNDLERLSLSSPGHHLIVNAEGYWLKGIQPDDEWGFMFEDRYQKTFAHRYPEVWQHILRKVKGQLSLRDGLFTYYKVYPLKEGIKSSSGSPKPFTESIHDISPDEYWWAVISWVNPQEIYKKGDKFLLILISTDIIFLGLLGLVSWLLIVADTRRRIAENALKQANQVLEEKVIQRTEELANANLALKKEAAEHRKAISEKLNVELKLQQVQRMEAIGTLAGGIAHDFNNILSSILGYTELALETLKAESPLKVDLQKVYAAGLRAKDLVSQILAFARQSDETLEPIQIDSITKEVLKFIRSSLPTTIEIIHHLDSKSFIMGDPTQVHRIIMNLATNAAHAMQDKGGTLKISLKDIQVDETTHEGNTRLKSGNYIELTVSDNGHGIEPHVIDKIFEPYFTTKVPGEGTGLGLAMVHGIVDSYGGKIFVESTPGIETVFKIYLPICRESIIHEPYMSKDLPKGDERILFVDDEVQIAAVARRMLGQLGYSVTTRTNSLEALKLFQSKPDDFDLVISDMTMPTMTGDQLARRIIDIRPDIPFILFTGYSKNISEMKILEIGIKALSYKPIVREDLAKTVRKILDEAKN